jgi:hypothetical protein
VEARQGREKSTYIIKTKPECESPEWQSKNHFEMKTYKRTGSRDHVQVTTKPNINANNIPKQRLSTRLQPGHQNIHSTSETSESNKYTKKAHNHMEQHHNNLRPVEQNEVKTAQRACLTHMW